MLEVFAVNTENRQNPPRSKPSNDVATSKPSWPTLRNITRQWRQAAREWMAMNLATENQAQLSERKIRLCRKAASAENDGLFIRFIP